LPILTQFVRDTFPSRNKPGFGDIRLQPGVFLIADLIIFSLLFLVAFVFVAAFLQKLTEACTSILGRRSLIEDLINQLRSTEELATDERMAARRGCRSFLDYCVQPFKQKSKS